MTSKIRSAGLAKTPLHSLPLPWTVQALLHHGKLLLFSPLVHKRKASERINQNYLEESDFWRKETPCCGTKIVAVCPALLCSFANSLFAFVVLAKSDEEIVDPGASIREECKKTCPKQQSHYDACVGRITEKKEGDCEAWFIELVTCIDKCVAPKVFQVTKGG